MTTTNPKAAPQLTARVAEVRRHLARWRAAALLVTNPRDVRYLTGFVGEDSWAVVLADSPTVRVLTDFRFQEQVRYEAPQAKAHIRKKGLAEELGKLARRGGLRRIVLQQDYVTLSQRKNLAKHVGASRLHPVQDKLIQQRAVKDEFEVQCIREALAIQQAVFRKVIGQLRPGQTEQAIAAKLECEMRLRGADGPSFPSIIAADAHASLCHAIPGPARVRQGGILLVDWGARYKGYCADMTRTVALGRMPAKIREIYRIVLEAQLAAIDAIAPGVSLKKVDAAARKIIDKAGYGKQFGHGLGHGIGLDVHEQPGFGKRSKGELKVGQVVTVEPGIYLPGVGGVRIEDDVLVTVKGRQVLSDLPKDLKSAII
jgi:Xaa-Pro aminopeptidase